MPEDKREEEPTSSIDGEHTEEVPTAPTIDDGTKGEQYDRIDAGRTTGNDPTTDDGMGGEQHDRIDAEHATGNDPTTDDGMGGEQHARIDAGRATGNDPMIDDGTGGVQHRVRASLTPTFHVSPIEDGTAEEQPAPAAASPEEGLPPEAQGETNGGPLGCCLGVIVGLLFSLVIAIVSRLYGDPLAQLLQGNLSIVVRIVMALVAAAGVVVFGYFGWKIGRKLFREYERPVVKDRRRKAKPRPKPKGI